MSLRLETLGDLRVLLDGVEDREMVGSPLRCALLVYMAVERRVPRERLLALLWPERPPNRARHNLSQMLYELRRRFDRDLLVLQGDHVLTTEEVSCDVAEFRDAVALGAPDAGGLYKGPFLHSVRLVDTSEFEEWVDLTREELRGLFREAQAARVKGLVEKGDLEAALTATRHWVSHEPLDEEAQRRLLTLLARQGLRNEALRRYESYRRRLEALRAKPLESLQTLVQDVRSGRLPDDPARRSVPTTAPQLAARTRVVVLPFEEMSSEGDHSHFCYGIAEEIISGLSGMAGLHVVPRTSAFALQGTRIRALAEDLGVTHAVEGSARFSDGAYRVTVRLIDARTEADIWDDRIEGSLSSDVFKVQDHIAAEVSRALQGHIGADGVRDERSVGTRRKARRRPRSVEAYHDYLKGRQAWFRRTPGSLDAALDHFRSALEKDCDYAQAHAGIADVYCLLGAFDYGVLPPKDAFPKAREAADRALRLDPDLAAAHAARGNVLVSFEWDWKAGAEAYRRAMAIDPGYSTARQWYSTLALYRGEKDRALFEAYLALELDPRSAHVSSHLARILQLLRRPERAAEQYRHTLQIDPHFVTAQAGLALTMLTLDERDEAVEQLRLLAERVGETLPFVLALYGYTLGTVERHDEARSVIRRLKATRASYLPPEYLGVAYLGVGEHDRAVSWLARAFEARSQAVTLFEREPILDPLRRNAAFRELLASIEAARSA